MPRYELSSRKPAKFWEIHVVGADYTLREGTIGTAGKETTINEVSHDAALEAATLLIEGRRRRGYELVAGTDPTATPEPEPADPTDPIVPSEDVDGEEPAAAPAAAKAPPFIPQNPALEEVIQADPLNAAGYLVYGDWLETQGHPWGELIAVQHALERDPEAEGAGALRDIEASFLKKYMRPLLGDLAHRSQVKLFFRLGFIARATVVETVGYGSRSLESLVRALQILPAARFLSDLSVGTLTHYERRDYGAVTALLTSRRAPKALRRLALGISAHHDNSMVGTMGWPLLGDIEALFAAFPRLEDVTLQTTDVHLGSIRLPELRGFELRSHTWARATIGSIVTADWPKLSRLVLWFCPALPRDDEQAILAPLLDWLGAGGLPSLRSLGLRCTSSTLELCKTLARSRALKQLESLDLWMGSLTDVGAREIARVDGAFAHLDVFNLENNRLTAEGFRALEGLAHNVRLGGQRV